MASNGVHWSKYTMLCANPIQSNAVQCAYFTKFLVILCPPVLTFTVCVCVCTTGMCSTAPVCSLLSNNRQVFLPELSLRSIITYNKLLLFGTSPSPFVSSSGVLVSLSLSHISSVFFLNVRCSRRKRTLVCVSAVSFVKQ